MFQQQSNWFSHFVLQVPCWFSICCLSSHALSPFLSNQGSGPGCCIGFLSVPGSTLPSLSLSIHQILRHFGFWDILDWNFLSVLPLTLSLSDQLGTAPIVVIGFISISYQKNLVIVKTIQLQFWIEIFYWFSLSCSLPLWPIDLNKFDQHITTTLLTRLDLTSVH